MNKYSFLKHSFILLALLCLLTFCYGQVKKKSSKEKVREPKIISFGNPKLVKTQGSTKSDNVWCGLQDKSGNLWFGTTGEGVYRYDGKLFYNYTIKDGLNSNAVYSILEDKSGYIWIGTTDGVCRYDGKKITRIPITANFFPTNSSNNYYNSQSTKNTVWSMLQDKSGKIWFGTGDGVYCYNGKSFSGFLQNERVINKQNLQLKMVDCMVEDNSGNIWFASGCPPGMEGVCMYDGESITSFKPNGDGWIRTIKEDKKGNLWFGGRSRGNFFYDGKNFTNFTEKVGIGNPVLVDKNGNIWFSGEEKLSTIESEGGIWCYDRKTFKNFSTKDGMSKYNVWSMLEDREGNIWIGTRNTGLYKYDGTTFTSYSE